jgi:hypothetical protein
LQVDAEAGQEAFGWIDQKTSKQARLRRGPAVQRDAAQPANGTTGLQTALLRILLEIKTFGKFMAGDACSRHSLVFSLCCNYKLLYNMFTTFGQMLLTEAQKQAASQPACHTAHAILSAFQNTHRSHQHAAV